MKVYEVMSIGVVFVKGETAVAEITRLLTLFGISSIPVVDDEQRVIGIVSKSDLFSYYGRSLPLNTASTIVTKGMSLSSPVEVYESIQGYTAADIMTQDVVCIDAKEELVYAAILMALHNLKRLPVLYTGRLAGMITKTSLDRVLQIWSKHSRSPITLHYLN